MLGISGTHHAGARSALTLPSMKLWVDSVTGVTGSSGGAIDSITNQAPAGGTMSNTSGTGTRPVWADATTNAGANMFKSQTKNGIHGESGGDWLSFDGTATAANVQCGTALSVFHVTRHTHGNTTPTNAYNCPLTILGSISSTTYTTVGFSAGTPRLITWDGGAYQTYNGNSTICNNDSPHSVGWVYQGTTLICYVDGVVDSTQTVTAYQTTNGFNSFIGGGGVADGFQGGLAEVMYWDAVLTPMQIKALHNRAVNLWF